MTTYTLAGVYYEFGAGNTATSFRPATFSFTLADGFTTLSYTHDTTPDGVNSTSLLFDNQGTQLFNPIFDGVMPLDQDDNNTYMVELDWIDDSGTAMTTTLLKIDIFSAGEFVFYIDGDPLPVLSTLAEFQDFNDNHITGERDVPAGTTFAEGQVFSVNDVGYMVSSEDDTIPGTAGNDSIAGGPGADVIGGLGGVDTLDGGAGEDWIVVNGDNDGTMVFGGADFDDVVIDDPNNPDALLVDFTYGGADEVRIVGRSDHGATPTVDYTITAVEIERVSIDFGTQSGGDVLILGDANDNRVRFNEFPNFFAFEGGAGTDQVDLHRTWVDDDTGGRIRGVSSTFLLTGADFVVNGNTVEIWNADGSGQVGALTDVENIRLTDGVFTVSDLVALDAGAPIAPTSGDDSLVGTSGDDSVDGLAGNDTMTGFAGNDTLEGGPGADSIDAGDGDDSVTGGDGDDTLTGGYGNDYVDGGAGNDRVTDGRGFDTVNGGTGIDTFYRDLAADFTAQSWTPIVDLGLGRFYDPADPPSLFDTLLNIENVQLLGDFNLSITGDSGANDLRSDLGSDTLDGAEGNDTLDGGAGDDTVLGGNGDDLIINSGGGADSFDGGAGIDTLETDVTGLTPAFVLLFDAVAGVHGREGSTIGQDTVSGIENFTMIGDWDARLVGDGSANLFISDNGDDTLTGGGGGDTLISGAGQDSLSGDNGNDLLQGGADNDTLDGGFSADTLEGGDGDDSLIGGYGDDSLDGGAGVDIADYSGFGGNITVNLNTTGGQYTGAAGTDSLTDIEGLVGGDYADRFIGRPDDSLLYGGLSADTLFGLGGNDTMDGEDGNDNLVGGSGADVLIGGTGRDALIGGTENDTLDGGADNDQLRGGDGADRLQGGLGRDILIGGDYTGGGFPGDGAADVFVYTDITESQRGGAGRDIIRDFEDGFDMLDLSAIDADTGTGGDDSFVFIGSAAFSGTAGELRVVHTAVATLVQADVDGDGNLDFDVVLNGVIAMDASDFVL